MALISTSQRRSGVALSKLHYCNPFLDGRIQLEREALGSKFLRELPVRVELHDDKDLNLKGLGERIEQVTGTLRQRLAAGAEAEACRTLYSSAAIFEKVMPYQRMTVRPLHGNIVNACFCGKFCGRNKVPIAA